MLAGLGNYFQIHPHPLKHYNGSVFRTWQAKRAGSSASHGRLYNLISSKANQIWLYPPSMDHISYYWECFGEYWCRPFKTVHMLFMDDPFICAYTLFPLNGLIQKQEGNLLGNFTQATAQKLLRFVKASSLGKTWSQVSFKAKWAKNQALYDFE